MNVGTVSAALVAGNPTVDAQSLRLTPPFSTDLTVLSSSYTAMPSEMYHNMVPQPVSSPNQSQPHRQQVGMNEQRLVHDRPQTPEENFLTSLRRSIEGHFNPVCIMQNDVLQAILTCYQGCYPFQLILANPNFQMYIAHCVEMNMPVVPTFLRALENSRFISVTADQMFVYLNVAHNSQVYSELTTDPTAHSHQSYHGPANGMGGTMTCGGDNVQELASINYKPQVFNHMNHIQYQNGNSESPTSVVEASPVYVQGGDENYGDDKPPRIFIQQGAVPTVFVPTTTVVSPRPNRQSVVHPSVQVSPNATNLAEYHGPTMISSPAQPKSAAHESGEAKVATERSNAGVKQSNKKRYRNYARKKKGKHQLNNTPDNVTNPEPTGADDCETSGLEEKVAKLSIDAVDDK